MADLLERVAEANVFSVWLDRNILDCLTNFAIEMRDIDEVCGVVSGKVRHIDSAAAMT
ncbi:hypothetical protein [Pararobbsia alpina]|uniref:hypothetical protein n=1 Tax=Pararobbsia alpina TaxID=621374 RepID=UPI001583443A|nr:hypothetical protein [Pararobbsia alpina]